MRAPLGDLEVDQRGSLRDSKRVLSRQNVSVGPLLGELAGRASLLGTLQARSYQYPETGSETDFRP
jgi:hypothetical protein